MESDFTRRYLARRGLDDALPEGEIQAARETVRKVTGAASLEADLEHISGGA